MLRPSSSSTWETMASLHMRQRQAFKWSTFCSSGLSQPSDGLGPFVALKSNMSIKYCLSRCASTISPLILVVLVTHGVINGIVHHFLLHVHDLTLLLELHHDLLNLRQLELCGCRTIQWEEHRRLPLCFLTGLQLSDRPACSWWPWLWWPLS